MSSRWITVDPHSFRWEAWLGESQDEPPAEPVPSERRAYHAVVVERFTIGAGHVVTRYRTIVTNTPVHGPLTKMENNS